MTTVQAPPAPAPAARRGAPRLGRSLVGGLLMVIGWWFWAWSLPALALLGWLAARDLHTPQEPS